MKPKRPIPHLIVSAGNFNQLLEEIRRAFLSIRVIIEPQVVRHVLLGRHVAMFILATHAGESVEAIQWRFGATRKEVLYAVWRVPRGFKKSWALKDTIRQISARALTFPPS